MRGLTQTASAAAVAALLAFPALADGGAAARCEALGKLSPHRVGDAMTRLSGELLGKDVTRWTRDDVANLMANVAACEGMPSVDGSAIRSATWAAQLRRGAARAIPVSDALAQVDAAFGRTASDPAGLPECVGVLSWRNDRKARSDNSSEVFGRDFADMGDGGARAAEYAAACLPSLEVVLKARGGYLASTAASLVADIGETAAMAARSARELAEPRDPRHVSAELRGRPLATASLGESARRMVEEANAQAEVPGRFPPDVAARLMGWAEDIIAAEADAADMAYARAVRSLISDRMFGG